MFTDLKSIDAVTRKGNERRDGNGKFPDTVFRITVTKAEATDKFPEKMFVGLGWFDVTSEGKVFRCDKQKLLRLEEVPTVMAALAEAQAFIDGGGDAPAGTDDEAPF